MAFDASGAVLGIWRAGLGLWLCTREGPSSIGQLLLEGGSATARYGWCGWSTTVPGLLAVGTDGGRVMLYSPKTGKLTTQKDGKHPGRAVCIACGDWLPDGRLAVASGQRLKVSAPVTDGAEWQTFSKFYIGKMVAKIPLAQVFSDKKGAYDTTPRFVAVSKGNPPYLAMTLGDKVVTVMDYSGVYKEEGFFIPLDYGQIVGMAWTVNEVLIIGLSNGYIVTVSAPLLMRQRKNAAAEVAGRTDNSGGGGSTRAMTTTRIFQHYLAALCDIDGAPAALGDTSVKLLAIDMHQWGGDGYLSIPADVPIDGFSLSVGVSLKSLACRVQPGEGGDVGEAHVVVSTTHGNIHCFSLPGAGAASFGA